MSEIYGPATYRQHLEDEFSRINPNCHCTQSKVLRRTGIRMILEGRSEEEPAKEGLAELMSECPTSKAVGLCCDVIQKCTELKFVQTDMGGLVSMAEVAIEEAVPDQLHKETIYE